MTVLSGVFGGGSAPVYVESNQLTGQTRKSGLFSAGFVLARLFGIILWPGLVAAWSMWTC